MYCLESYFSQLDIIGSLQPGERLYHEESTNGEESKTVIAGKYNSATSLFSSAIQAFGRSWSDQSTLKSTQVICSLAEKIFQCLDKMDKMLETKFVYYSRSATKIQILYTLTFKLYDAFTVGINSLKQTISDPKYQQNLFGKDARLITQELEALNQAESYFTKSYHTAQNVLKCHLELRKSDLINVTSPAETILWTIDAILSEHPRAYHADQINLTKCYDLSTDFILEKLHLIYGPALVTYMATMYKFADKLFSTYDDIRALMIGCAANLTIEDIFWILRYSSHPVRHKYDSLDTITEPQLVDILRLIRFVHLDRSDIQIDASCSYKEQLEGDIKVIDACEIASKLYNHHHSPYKSISKLTSLKAKFGFTELIGKIYMPALYSSLKHHFRSGLLLHIYEENGDPLIIKAGHLIQNFQESGVSLCAAIFTPLDPYSEECYVAFRGPFDVSTFTRDIANLEKQRWFCYDGPPATNFAIIASTCLANFQISVPITARSIKVIGHSLGVMDAMRFINALTIQLEKEQLTPKIRSVELYAYNPVYIDEESLKSFNASVKRIPECQFIFRYFKTIGDIVQKPGSYLLGFDRHQQDTDPDNCHISMMLFDRENKNNQPSSSQVQPYLPSPSMINEGKTSKHPHAMLLFSDCSQESEINLTYATGIWTNHIVDTRLRFMGDYEKSPKSVSNKTLMNQILSSDLTLAHLH